MCLEFSFNKSAIDLSNVHPACGHKEVLSKVNGSHHGDNPLLRPTGIQIATNSYATLQAMAPTNAKTFHQTSLFHIESNLDRLGLLSPTQTSVLSNKADELRSNQF